MVATPSPSRTLSVSVPARLGRTVRMQGWVHHLRRIGQLTFLVLRDRAGTTQCVLQGNPLLALCEEAVVELTGHVHEDARAPGGCEVRVESVKVLQAPAAPLPFPVNRPPEVARPRLDTRLNHRVLSLRQPEAQAVFRVQNALVDGFRDFLRSQGFAEIRTPKLVASGTEGGTALFPVQYFERRAYLAQSPQFYKQMMVGAGFERVFEVGPVFRAEPHSTARHLNEYTSLDVEVGFIDSQSDLLALETELLRAMLAHARAECGPALEVLGATLPDVPESIPQFTLDEAAGILDERFGKPIDGDLDPEGERLLCQYVQEEHGSDFVFVTGYPAAKRPMYAMPSAENPERAESFDLLFRGLEITTGGQRIHDPEMLAGNMRARGLDPADFGFYLEAFQYGMPPHGGFAIGAERLTAQLLGLRNVREACAFPRDRNRIVP